SGGVWRPRSVLFLCAAHTAVGIKKIGVLPINFGMGGGRRDENYGSARAGGKKKSATSKPPICAMLAKVTKFLCDFQAESWVNSMCCRSLRSSKKLIGASTDARDPMWHWRSSTGAWWRADPDPK